MTVPVVGQREWRQPEGALLFSMGGPLRVFVWGLALLLTTAVLLYPTDLRLVDAPIQSTAIIENLPLFAALYYLWLLTILALLFSKAKLPST